MRKNLLSIGSVVLLKESKKRIMIIGILQKQVTEDGERIWDYAGCLYPEGYMGPNRNFLFNDDQIDKIYALGYKDAELFEFEEKVAEALEQLNR